MGYFANGTEGDNYEARWCARCIHQNDDKTGCPVWNAHLLYNYEQLNTGRESLKDALDMLIPREGPWNGQCRMFRERPNAPLPGQLGLNFEAGAADEKGE